jgi:hypothetical protein
VTGDASDCPECRVPLEPSGPAGRESLVCPRCGLDTLALRMMTVAGDEMVWDYRDARFSLRWRTDTPSAPELTAVKKLLPELKKVSTPELLLTLGRSDIWEVGVLPAQDARALFLRAHELELAPAIEYLPETRGTSLDAHAHAADGDDAED